MDEDLTKDQLEKIVKECSWLNCTTDPVTDVVEVKSEDAIPKGFNYSGRLLRITACLKHKSGLLRNISVVNKRTPISQDQCNFIAEHGLFVTETKTYDEVLKKMERLVKSTAEDSEIDWPTHFTINKENSMLLQDLKECGYITIKQREATFEEGALVAKAIGRLHAMSKLLIDDGSVNISDYYVNQMAQNDTIIQFVYIATLRAIIDAIRTTRQSAWYKQADELESSMNKIALGLEEIVKSSRRNYNVLNHGDCWLNNIMFKYVPQNSEPQSIKLIDFQLCYYNSLAWDLTHFLYCSYLREKRELYMVKLVTEYRSSLTETFQKYGAAEKAEKVPSVEEILKYIEELKLFAILVGLATVPRLVPGLSFNLDLDITQPDEAHKAKTSLYAIPQVFRNLQHDLQQLCHIVQQL